MVFSHSCGNHTIRVERRFKSSAEVKSTGPVIKADLSSLSDPVSLALVCLDLDLAVSSVVREHPVTYSAIEKP